MKKLLFLILACFCIILTGVSTNIHLGDEVLHYRLAKTIFYTSNWPLFDPLNQSFGTQKLFYVDPMLWHTILAVLWKIFFGISQITAQIYQAAYFFIFILSVYIFSKKLYDEETANFAALLLISTPGILLLSVIFHTDMPAIALASLAIALISKEKFFWAGIITGLGFLIKRTTMIFIPGYLIFLIYFLKGDRKNKVFKILNFLIPAAIFLFFSQKHNSSALSQLNSSIDNSQLLMYCQNINFYLKDIFDLKNNPLVLPAFLGIATIASLCSYIIAKAYSKRDLILWTAIISFVIVYLVYFTKNLSLRYSLILLPFICLIGAKGISALKNSTTKKIITILCIMQFFFTLGFILTQRRITAQEKEAFSYIKLKTTPDSRFMCTRPDLQLYTDRKTIWNNYLSLKELPCLFWVANEEQIKAILNKYQIDYLFIEKMRIYDDTSEKHQLGWPKSFISKIPKLTIFELKFENEQVSLWKIKK